jgi:hypothetical protein
MPLVSTGMKSPVTIALRMVQGTTAAAADAQITVARTIDARSRPIDQRHNPARGTKAVATARASDDSPRRNPPAAATQARRRGAASSTSRTIPARSRMLLMFSVSVVVHCSIAWKFRA